MTDAIVRSGPEAVAKMSIADLRREMGVSLEQLAGMVGLASRGRMSVIEREGRCSFAVALEIERISGGRIDASDLNDDVRLARHGHVSTSAAPAPSSGKDRRLSRDTAASVTDKSTQGS
jgi:hypothetical protein